MNVNSVSEADYLERVSAGRRQKEHQQIEGLQLLLLGGEFYRHVHVCHLHTPRHPQIQQHFTHKIPEQCSSWLKAEEAITQSTQGRRAEEHVT